MIYLDPTPDLCYYYDMELETYQSLYGLLSTLCPIPVDEWERAKNIFQGMKLDKNNFFIRAGEKPVKIGFVSTGILRLYYTTENGDEYIKGFCLPNDFVAAYSALLESRESRLSIQALENSTLLVADFREFARLIDNHPCWQIISRKVAESLFIKKEKRESEFLLDSARTRYLRFLGEYPGLEDRVKQYDIASYLGITPVALSRIRAQIRNNS